MLALLHYFNQLSLLLFPDQTEKQGLNKYKLESSLQCMKTKYLVQYPFLAAHECGNGH